MSKQAALIAVVGVLSLMLSACVSMPSQSGQSAQPAAKAEASAPEQQKVAAAPQESTNSVSSVLGDMPESCVKLAAAIKGCDQTGGLFSGACKRIAQSRFDCPLPLDQIIR